MQLIDNEQFVKPFLSKNSFSYAKSLSPLSLSHSLHLSLFPIDLIKKLLHLKLVDDLIS